MRDSDSSRVSISSALHRVHWKGRAHSSRALKRLRKHSMLALCKLQGAKQSAHLRASRQPVPAFVRSQESAYVDRASCS
jgi:hypothetical protein